MEEVGASTQPRLHFSRGTLSDRPGTSFPPRGKNCNSTISGEHIFSDIISTSSSIFIADRFSDFSDGCYSSGLSTYMTNSVVPEGVLASIYVLKCGRLVFLFFPDYCLIFSGGYRGPTF
jgi:hypothetical protein